MRKPIIAGNWKMHNNKAQAKQLIDGITYGVSQLDATKMPEVVIAPTYTALWQAYDLIKNEGVIESLYSGSKASSTTSSSIRTEVTSSRDYASSVPRTGTFINNVTTTSNDIRNNQLSMQNIINIMNNKYGNNTRSLASIHSYLKTGDPTYITSDNGIRQTISRLGVQGVQKALLNEYLNPKTVAIIEKAIIDTNNRFNQDVGKHGILKYLNSNDSTGITNQTGARFRIL